MTPPDRNSVSVLYLLERDVKRIDKDAAETRADVADLRVAVASIGAKLAVYSALGAVLGGGAISLVLHFLTR